MPALQLIDNQGIFIGSLFGFIISLPVALFLAFWLSAVKRRGAVIVGAFLGALIGFVVILGWAGTLIFDTPLPGATGVAAFFGSIPFCTTLGLVGGMLVDLLVARASQKDYRRQIAH
ncbi:MAG: PTS sucrose transporter subunit IIBC [Ktedonobacteraceae bacterium]|nr:PTS sucrose transporter subunit IIBC [Ktedonobacteraceae bacterium]